MVHNHNILQAKLQKTNAHHTHHSDTVRLLVVDSGEQ